MSYYTEITPTEAQALLQENNTMLLDSRDPHSYRESHVDGAMMVHDGLIEQLIRKRRPELSLIIYCYHGNSSRDLAEMLGRSGYPKVYSVMGGYTAWKKLQAA